MQIITVKAAKTLVVHIDPMPDIKEGKMLYYWYIEFEKIAIESKKEYNTPENAERNFIKFYNEQGFPNAYKFKYGE